MADQPALMAKVLSDAVDLPVLPLDALIADRAARLVDYQNAAYADRYRAVMTDVVDGETAALGRPGRLSRAAAEGLYRVMAYKDEYEVARLHLLASYGEKPVFHMSPPLIARMDPATGRRRKIAVPGWVALPLFRVLRLGKSVRGTALDLFGRQEERQAERALVEQYIGDLRAAVASLRADTQEVAVGLASLPDTIRGFGPVKDANREKAAIRRVALLEKLAMQPMAMAAE